MALTNAIAGALRPSQNITWSDADGNAMNLTGATLSGTLRSHRTGVVRAIAGNLVIIDAENGAFRWDYHADDLVAGRYTVQFTASFGDSPTPARTFAEMWSVAEAQLVAG